MENILEGFEQTESRGGVKDLSGDTCRKTIVQTHESVRLEHLGDGKGLTTCTGQVGSDSGRVEGMDDGPSHAAAKTGRGKDDGFA